MFYFKNWECFCAFLQSKKIFCCTASESLNVMKDTQCIVLKHDVEGDVPKAYKLAQIETSHGIKGSYYVQGYLMKDSKNIAMLQEMQTWGHEISYHYDVLDACNGDYERAIREFSDFLNLFYKAGFCFNTICQHGNPVKRRVGYTSNRDFFRNEKVRTLYPQFVDMVVDYSHYVKYEYKYISDAGYCWNIITLPETNDLYPDVKNIKIGSFSNLMDEVNKGVSLVISTHPHRWKSSFIAIYSHIYFFRIVRFVIKSILHIPGVENILSKFYFLAKKI